MKTSLFKSLWGRALVLALALAVVVVGVVLAADATPDYIDTFDAPGGGQSVSVTVNDSTFPDVAVSSVAATGVIGGERDIVLETEAGDVGQGLSVTVNNGSDGKLTVTSGTNLRYAVAVQYDGSADATKSDVDYTGLNNYDLTLAGGSSGFLVAVPFSDLGGRIRITVYTDANRCSQRLLLPASGINDKNQRLYYAAFSGFGSACTNPADFTDVGAIVISIETTTGSVSLDINLELFAAVESPYADYGDLPQDGVTYHFDDYLYRYDDGNDSPNDVRPAHLAVGPYMGSTRDLESSATRNATADGDDTGTDDEDGVLPTGNWSSLGGGIVKITVDGCAGTCYVTGFIDWNGDNNFWDVAGDNYDAGERVLSGYAVSNGTHDINFSIPVNPSNGNYYARFRITTENVGTNGTPWGAYYSGEIEDYLWDFGPNAVTLNDLSATSSTPWMAVALGAGLLVTLAAGALVLRRKLA